MNMHIDIELRECLFCGKERITEHYVCEEIKDRFIKLSEETRKILSRS